MEAVFSESQQTSPPQTYLQENVKQIAAQTLNGIIERKNVYPLAILDIMASVHGAKVAQLDAEIITGDCDGGELDSGLFSNCGRAFVHLNLALVDVLRAKADENCEAKF